MRDDREPSGHGVDQPSVGDPHVGARIAQARRDAALTQRALADLVGVRLWVVDRWEAGTRAVSSEQLEIVAKATKRTLQWLETGVDEHSSAQSAPEQADAEAPLEAARKEIDKRLSEVRQREKKVRRKEHELQLALADAAERATVESEPAEQAEIEAERRLLEERLAEVAEREAALERREQELQAAALAQANEQRAGLGDGQDDPSELEEEARRHEELRARIAEREEALARTELEVQQALAQVDELRAETWRERARLAEIEEARQQVESSRAEVAKRERVVAEREQQVSALAAGLGGDASELKAVAQWLADSVKAAAKREAETVIKAARAQARLIVENAKAGHDPPVEDSRREQPVEESDSPPR